MPKSFSIIIMIFGCVWNLDVQTVEGFPKGKDKHREKRNKLISFTNPFPFLFFLHKSHCLSEWTCQNKNKTTYQKFEISRSPFRPKKSEIWPLEIAPIVTMEPKMEYWKMTIYKLHQFRYFSTNLYSIPIKRGKKGLTRQTSARNRWRPSLIADWVGAE